MFHDGLYSLLKSQAALTALLGTSRGDNTTGIFPEQAIREPVLPYVVYTLISGVPQSFTQGGANALQRARYRFQCVGSSQRQAATVANFFKSFFASYTGTLSEGSVVQQVMQESDVFESESVPNGTIWSEHVDFVFYYVDGTVA